MGCKGVSPKGNIINETIRMLGSTINIPVCLYNQMTHKKRTDINALSKVVKPVHSIYKFSFYRKANKI